MKVHMSVDVGYGTEVFFAVETAESRPTIRQHDRTTSILPLDWSSNYVQSELSQNIQHCIQYSRFMTKQ